LYKKGIHPYNILYINKEIADFEYIKEDKDLNDCIQLYLSRLNPQGKIYLFFDEVQLISNWERIINSYSQDYTAEYEVIISGSNSTLLSGELATLLTGRYLAFQVFPYSFSEFCQVTGNTPGKPAFIEFLKNGALPELFHLPDPETRQHYVHALKNTIVLKDVIVRNNIKDPGLLESLFAYLVQNVSNPVSIQNITNYFINLKVATTFNTISTYIEYLKQTFIIHEVTRFDLKGKKILGGSRKYYLNDLSFRNLLYSGFEAGLGYLLENLVFLEFKRNGYEIFTGAERNMEIDFVLKKGSTLKYAQVCYLLTDETVVEREFGNLERIRDNYEKMVISLDDISMGNRRGIMHYPAWEPGIYK